MDLPFLGLRTGAGTKPPPPPAVSNGLVEEELGRRSDVNLQEAAARYQGRVAEAEVVLKSELRERLLVEIRDDLRVNATEMNLPLSEQTETRARNLLDPNNAHPNTPDAVAIRNLVLGENAQGIFQTRLISTWVPRIAAWLRSRLEERDMRLYLMATLRTGHHQYLFQLVTGVIHEVQTQLAPEFATAAPPAPQERGPDTLPARGGRRPSLPIVRLNRKLGLLGTEGQKKSLKALLSWLRLTHFPLVEGYRPFRFQRARAQDSQWVEGAD
tara:strand:- start:932 stop:1741 length:810 start_codon:yes stop_codon:yes gene_type:complete